MGRWWRTVLTILECLSNSKTPIGWVDDGRAWLTWGEDGRIKIDTKAAAELRRDRFVYGNTPDHPHAVAAAMTALLEKPRSKWLPHAGVAPDVTRGFSVILPGTAGDPSLHLGGQLGDAPWSRPAKSRGAPPVSDPQSFPQVPRRLSD